LVQKGQYYDRIAAYITRKHKVLTNNRYNFKQPNFETIDFQQLASEIAEVVNQRNIHKFYEFVYYNKDLGLLNESLEFAHTALRIHLLIIANLIVRDYLLGI